MIVLEPQRHGDAEKKMKILIVRSKIRQSLTMPVRFARRPVCRDGTGRQALLRNDMGLGLDAGSAAILKSSLRYISILQKISRLEFFIYKAILGLMLLMLHELSCNSEHLNRTRVGVFFPSTHAFLTQVLLYIALNMEV